ncbi:peptidyl-prolyl cis-trans isomerase [Maritimibacter sp. UBA3975]|uniref:peptidyl-prolyl cis-trans isomerase n=1 Tax=Maritimibacter sp. UBA3975 TaxID=1946833 RepID=UPI000C09A373|nr:peptidyl-prolyl cis-trans isomerase [Maritimibacter sp. UBA3975]MAM60286.1 peptidylprolyl isomerase [Maritimibacter sp.]|tara:strand:+ start:103 stop:1944 length:1842 start_codon:yes stop_codon:yes gene_type:complete
MFSNISRFFVWIIMALVVVGLVGFGSVNFGGSGQSIGKVGDTEIDASAYFRELNAELNAWQATTGENLTMAEAQAIGLDQRVLSRVISITALEDEIDRMKLSVGDQNLANRVTEIQAFQGVDGQFDRDTYDFVLQQSGLTAQEFEESLRAEVARTILADAVTSGVDVPDTYTATLYAWARETRDFTWAPVTRSALEEPLPEPTEADLQAFYDENPDPFTVPETRQITYGWLKPEDVMDEVPMDDGQLRDLYESRIDEFQVPERRLVERLVFGTEDDAQAAADRIESGETTFDQEVEARGLTLSDVDLGDVRQRALGQAGEPVFALEEPGVVGPVMTDLGPALLRMNAILSAQETSFEDARDQLFEEYAADAARRLVRTRASEIDEMLAGGATLEELDSEGLMPLDTIGWTEGMDDGIAAYAPFREAAAEASVNDFPQVTELEDGSVFALRLDEITEPTLRPFDEVRDEVQALWEQNALADALVARAEALLPEFESGAEAPSTVGLTEVLEEDVPRTAFIQGAPENMVEQAFTMAEGSWQVVRGNGQVVVVGLTDIQSPDQDSDEAQQIKSAFSQRMSQTLGLDLQDAFSSALEDQAGVSLDQAMINAVHANFP